MLYCTDHKLLCVCILNGGDHWPVIWPGAGESRLAMVLKEGDKFPMGSTFQILGEGGPAVSSFHDAPGLSCRENAVVRTCPPMTHEHGILSGCNNGAHGGWIVQGCYRDQWEHLELFFFANIRITSVVAPTWIVSMWRMRLRNAHEPLIEEGWWEPLRTNSSSWSSQQQ